MIIGGIAVGTILTYITDLIESSSLPSERNNGYFTLRTMNDGQVVLIARIGVCKPEKADKYLSFSQEKGLRLFQQREHDVSSWQTRNEEKDLWGGAIIAGDFILSFSGLPELTDEAVMIKTALLCKWASEETLCQIAEISDNRLFLDRLRRR